MKRRNISSILPQFSDFKNQNNELTITFIPPIFKKLFRNCCKRGETVFFLCSFS
jgi:hypothetical protein